MAGNTEDEVDPFYPSPDVPPYYQDKIDSCLGFVSANRPFYQFYSFSPCMQASPQKSSSSGQSCASYPGCKSDVKTYMTNGISKQVNPVGVALDGHIIYAPFKSNTQQWDYCDVDVCNGLQVNGVYAYAMTSFHPYTVACWGPGNKSILQQSCSTNPKMCLTP